LGNKSKYNLLMRRRIRSSFREWEQHEAISEKDMYSFLYKARGIAKSLGMQHIEYLASDKIAQITDDPAIMWTKVEWQSFLAPFYEILTQEVEEEEEKRESGPGGTFKFYDPEMKLEDIDRSMQQDTKQDNEVILLIDNDVEFLTVLKERLETEGYHVSIALTIEKGFSLFYSMAPAFVMVNIHLMESIQNLEKFGKIVKQTLTPLALISDTNELKHRTFAYELGATDFIQKEVLDPEWFIPYLKNRLAFSQRILIDELTGACNRKYMERALADLLANFKRYGEVFSIAIIDIDFFKQVNDGHGHLVGDEVLKRLVNLINEHKRKTDDLCRFGGEEFVLCLPRTTEEGAEVLLNRIREAFSEVEFTSENGSFQVTFSAGIVGVNPANQVKEKLLDEADKALYKSKASGRNCITIYSPAYENAVNRKLHIIIVDDDRLIRTILMRSFAQWKPANDIEVLVHTYKDGTELLEADWYKPSDHYIILLDGIMPKMNGIEVLERLRAQYNDKNIVISMLSARSGEANIVHALEKGADDYMLKPFKVPEVLARIGRLARRMLL